MKNSEVASLKKEGKSKKNRSIIPYVIIIIVLVIASCGIIFSMYVTKKIEFAIKDIKIIQLEREIGAADSTLKVFLKREQRLRNIQITLLANYQLTQYEARYYSIIFNDFSLHYNIPWEIYASLVRIESNFNGGAKSKREAKGLTQVLEGTAKEVCKKLQIKYKKDETLWNDIINMVIGFTYLSEGIRDKGFEYGVKKYIGGPGWSKTEKKNGLMGKYIKEYKTTVSREFVRNRLIYKGISSSAIHSVDLDTVLKDPLKTDSLFVKGNYLKVVGIKDDKK